MLKISAIIPILVGIELLSVAVVGCSETPSILGTTTEPAKQKTEGIETNGILGEPYLVPDGHGGTTPVELRTVASWTGTESEVINFSIGNSPWVVNCWCEVTSSLGHNFNYTVFTEDEYRAGNDAFSQYLEHEILTPVRISGNGEDSLLVKQSGKFVICVNASGVRWKLRVGVE